MRRVFCWTASVALIGALLPCTAAAQEAAGFFEEHCAVCHTIGGGDQAGPDLKGSMDRKDRRWLIRFLLDPERVVKSGDEYATRLVAKWGDVVMPATDGLTREMAEALVDFITARSHQAPETPALPPPITFTDADRTRGLEIFTGRTRLTNAGPPCVSCHALGGFAGTAGGLLGPDLTAVHGRLGGVRGTTAWLTRPPTPMMRAIYRSATFTEDEARSLAALFESTATTATASSHRRWFVLTGVGGTIACLAAIGLVWQGRFRSVRRRLLDDGRGRNGR